MAEATSLIGKLIAHYQILEKLGAGGMGEVWRAHDTQLDRDVALKVLPADRFFDESARARLVREARMASKLNHPYVCTIHEVGESEGQAYIAMELVEGRTLSARLAGGALTTEEVLRIGQQVADAVAHAHEKGVVHRDLKCANVILTPTDRAKVLDFGLAKRLSNEALAEATTLTQDSLTGPGVLAGTPAYMAPEQLRGQAADARSDIWALGVVLYEMAAGARPFQGQTGFELSSAILKEAPRPLSAEVPAELRAVIGRCLEKDPTRRYQGASEVRAALESIQAGTVAPWAAWRYTLARRRWLALVAALVIVVMVLAVVLRGRLGGPQRAVKLAVLPFANLSGDPEQEYLSDGLTQEMITQLGRLHPERLSVIARTSVMRYKKSDKPIDQVGRELGVDYILEGSARREAGRVRITAELIQVRSQTQLWAESFERELAGILALQSEVAQRVAGSLALKLLPAEQARLANGRTVNPEAYEAVLKGVEHWYKVTPQDVDTALEYFELALKKDPNYAPAYSGIASVWLARQQWGYTAPREAGPKAKAAALKAVELDNTLAGAHSALAVVKAFYEWDWAGAETEFRRAIELDPNVADARVGYSYYLTCMRRHEEATAQVQRAMELDPLNAYFQGSHAAALHFAGRYDDAIVQFRKALRASPDLRNSHGMFAVALFTKGLYEESLAEMKAYYAGDREVEEALTQGYAQSGYPGAMRRAADLLATRSRKTYVIPFDVAGNYALAGEKAQALGWLEKALEVRDPNMPYVSVDPALDTLRNTPRFQDILRRMNLPR